jgi:hypothetical protein
MERLTGVCRIYGPASGQLTRDVISIVVVLGSVIAAGNYVSIYAALAVVIAWLELLRRTDSNEGIEVALAAALAVVLFFIYYPGFEFGLLRRFHRPLGFGLCAVLLAVAYARYRTPALKAAIVLLSWAAFVHTLSDLGRYLWIPKMASREHATLLYFYNVYWAEIFMLLYALPVGALAFALDRKSLTDEGPVSGVATGLYVVVLPFTLWALLMPGHPTWILHPTMLYYQAPLAVFLCLVAAYTALLVDRRSILFWTLAALLIAMARRYSPTEHLLAWFLMSLSLLALHLHWDAARKVALRMTQTIATIVLFRRRTAD